MATEVNLPELGENVDGGTVVEILVSAGDSINEGQPLLEVEAGKSTVEVPAPVAGVIKAVLVRKGDEVKTGQALVQVEDGKPSAPKTKSAPAAAAPAPSASPARTADKATAGNAPPPVEAPRPEATPLPRPHTNGSGPPAGDRASAGVPVLASPATRQLARELGVNISDVTGSAKNGRVTAEDVKAFVRQLAGAAPAGGSVAAAPRLPDFGKWGPVETQPLSGIRRETARQMATAWALIPHVTQHDLADVTELDAFRRSQPKEGPRITITAFALKAAAIALRQFPNFNASLDLANNRLVLKRYYHIGVAVDTERGLLVPVIRDVDKKSVHQLAGELAAAADRGRQRKLTADDMSGGTFTITNLGGIGGTGFTPIINYPEVAILGLSRARLEPVVHQGSVAPRLMLPLSLSYDHRLIDGADAARFTRRVVEMLENPLVMLLHA